MKKISEVLPLWEEPPSGGKNPEGVRVDDNGNRVVDIKPEGEKGFSISENIIPLLTGGGAALLGHSLASGMFEDEDRDSPLWRKVLSKLIPIGIGAAGAYGGYHLGKMLKTSQDNAATNANFFISRMKPGPNGSVTVPEDMTYGYDRDSGTRFYLGDYGAAQDDNKTNWINWWLKGIMPISAGAFSWKRGLRNIGDANRWNPSKVWGDATKTMQNDPGVSLESAIRASDAYPKSRTGQILMDRLMRQRGDYKNKVDEAKAWDAHEAYENAAARERDWADYTSANSKYEARRAANETNRARLEAFNRAIGAKGKAPSVNLVDVPPGPDTAPAKPTSQRPSPSETVRPTSTKPASRPTVGRDPLETGWRSPWSLQAKGWGKNALGTLLTWLGASNVRDAYRNGRRMDDQENAYNSPAGLELRARLGLDRMSPDERAKVVQRHKALRDAWKKMPEAEKAKVRAAYKGLQQQQSAEEAKKE